LRRSLDDEARRIAANIAKLPEMVWGQRPRASPPIRRLSSKTGKISIRQDCVVGLRGLELRAGHAVAIETGLRHCPQLRARVYRAGTEEVCLVPTFIEA